VIGFWESVSQPERPGEGCRINVEARVHCATSTSGRKIKRRTGGIRGLLRVFETVTWEGGEAKQSASLNVGGSRRPGNEKLSKKAHSSWGSQEKKKGAFGTKKGLRQRGGNRY